MVIEWLESKGDVHHAATDYLVFREHAFSFVASG